MRLKNEHLLKLQCDVALNRNQFAYKELFISFYQSLTSFAATMVSAEEVAEEIYSDTMLKIWLMEEKLNEVEDLKQYLFKMIKNAALSHLKKTAKGTFTDLDSIDLVAFSCRSPEDMLLKTELQNQISAAVLSLPPQCQLVYRLIREDEFNYRQTAELLDLSVNTVERHMNNAVKKIVGYLKPYVISAH